MVLKHGFELPVDLVNEKRQKQSCTTCLLSCLLSVSEGGSIKIRYISLLKDSIEENTLLR